MDARRAAAVALVIPALALGGAACGGNGATKTTAKEQHAVEAHWRKGLLRWHHDTQHALNGLSILFSTDGALTELTSVSSKASLSLASFEGVLVQCTTTVRGLGPVPPAFAMAGRYALRTCASLEQGERAVEVVVGKIRRGGGLDTLDPLSGAGDLLSTGQAELTTTVHALNVPE
jgi:hypothetical protein